MEWRPGASLDVLKVRADAYQRIRAFFEARQVLEVDTPILGASSACDPHLDSMALSAQAHGATGSVRYLHTSPEFPMKRLLASGSGDIYQLCKTFRSGEQGRRHNPEFTMLEWYRCGFTLDALMEEVHALVCEVLGRPLAVEKLDYRAVFLERLGIDPMSAPIEDLKHLSRERLDFEPHDGMGRDDYLDLLLSGLIEPELGRGKATFLSAYPASQAALAQIETDADGHRVAQRFELYLDGLEIANAYRELQDAQEQRRRFMQDNRVRAEAGKPEVRIDEPLLAALSHGMPDCSGVALGVDRLLMIKTGASDIDQVLAFSWARS